MKVNPPTFKNKINAFILNFVLNTWIKLSRWIPSDKLFLKVYYLLKMKGKLDLMRPQTYTQKIQWLKLHNTNPLYSLLVDKYSVKKIISEKIGNQYIIPIIGVWNKFEEIDFNTLPEQFVLKTTHDSGNVFICKDKNKIDINYLKVRINKALKLNYFYKSREYPYKKVVPRIMAEKYMDDNTQEELTDYKFFCFHGEPKIVQISSGKGAKKRIGFYDMDFNLLPLSTDANIADLSLEKPNNFDQMVEISKTLSCDMIHVRIDLYLINQQIYFGEYTFHNNGGIVHFSPPEWNTTLGDMINLPIV